MKGRLRSWLLAFFTALLLALAVAPSVEAQTKTLRWHRWDVDIQINADGTFHVSELFEIEFIGGDFTFGVRDIPVDQVEQITNISVREGGRQYEESYSGQPNTFYWTRDGNEIVINWFYPPTRDATRLFVVEYTVVGGLIVGDEYHRFFWKAVGPEHDFTIESSTVTVRMPPGAAIDTTLEPVYFGVSNATYSVAGDLASVTWQTNNIPPQAEFEVGVRFPSAAVPNAAKPSWQAEYEREQTWNDTWRPILNLLAGVLGVFLLIGGLVGVYFLWLLRGRDPKVGVAPSYLAEPPSDLPPGVVGTLVDEKADLQDIVATLVDLARRGAIVMQEKEMKVFGFTTGKDFVFVRRNDYEGTLRPFESLLLKAMFGSRDQVELDDLRNKFYTAIPRLQRELYQEVVQAGLFPTSPQVIRQRWLGLGITGLVLSVGVGFCAMSALAGRIDAVLCPFAALGVVSVSLIAVSGVMPVKTRKGAEEASKWEAFKAYLQSAERYADLREVTEQFDRYLAYAIAFGLERTWVNKFSRIPNTPIPSWYFPVGMPHYARGHGRTATGGGEIGEVPQSLAGSAVRPAPSLDGMAQSMFGGLSSMSDGLFSMLNSTARVFSSVPSSSGSGGGFSGGGFSRGGGGGGGGARFG